MYLSMFQKGHEISTYRLVWGWIAEGFIPGEVGMTLREQGERYLSDLISRGFLVAIKVDVGGKALSCRLSNDEVHRSIASLSAEENYVTIVDGQQVTQLPQSVHRLSIQGNNTPSTQVPLSRVSSLVVCGHANPFHQETGGTDSFLSLSKFENLSVLDLGGCASLKNDHLKGIENLLLLKCLVLGGDCISNIPRQIGSLVFLQTLDLRASRVKELPESIASARKLECLLVNRHTKIPDAVGKMKAVEVLGDINISRKKLLEELRNLPALRVLKIVIWSWDDIYEKELLIYLGSLGSQKIQSLSIFICCSLDFLEELDTGRTPNKHLQELEIRHSTFVNLPKWISSLTKLSSLSIEVHKLSQEIIEMLGKLDTLGSLFLTSKHAPKGNFRNGFINLTSFHFASSALGMIFVPGGMLKLERLHLSFQASLTKDFSQDFDFGLENLSSLKHIHVEIICYNATSRVVQDIKKAIIRAIHRNRSGGAELVINEVRKEDMEKNEDGQVLHFTQNNSSFHKFLLLLFSKKSMFSSSCLHHFSFNTSTTANQYMPFLHQTMYVYAAS
jgi:Leucine-rich repeat (LRR) protein